MRNRRIVLIGTLFALAASAVNGTVGVFVKNLYQMGFDYYQASFYKCALAFFILYLICISNKKMYQEFKRLLQDLLPIAICAFFGLFILYFFETSAYQYMLVPEVVLLLMVGSVITTIILSIFLLKDKITPSGWIAFVIALIGIALLTDKSQNFSLIGCVVALISGVGYGGFLVCSRYFKIKATVPFLCLLLLFGTLYLMIPFLIFSNPVLPNAEGVFDITILAVFPTILGFYFTTKALEYISSNKAQLIELTEPLFALIFAMIFLHEFLTLSQLLAMSLIILALYISESEILKKVNIFAK